MNLSTVIQETEYWYRRLNRQILIRKRSRNSTEQKYHTNYVKEIIKNIRDWQRIYDNWDNSKN